MKTYFKKCLFPTIVTAMLSLPSCLQGKNESSKQKSNKDEPTESKGECGEIKVTNKMSLEKRLINGAAFWTTGFDLKDVSQDSGTTGTSGTTATSLTDSTKEAPKPKSGKAESEGKKAGILGSMGEPPVSLHRTFQMKDADDKLVAEGKESLFKLKKTIEVFDCNKVLLGRIERAAGDAAKAFFVRLIQKSTGASGLDTLPFKTSSVFGIYDNSGKLVAYSHKKDLGVTDYRIQELEDPIELGVITEDDVKKEDGSKPITVVPQTKSTQTNAKFDPTWTITRPLLLSGVLDKWKIEKKATSKLDYRLLLMIPAFKTDKDISVPLSFGL